MVTARVATATATVTHHLYASLQVRGFSSSLAPATQSTTNGSSSVPLPLYAWSTMTDQGVTYGLQGRFRSVKSELEALDEDCGWVSAFSGTMMVDSDELIRLLQRGDLVGF